MKNSGQDRSTAEHYQSFKELTPIFLKLLHKVEGKEYFQTHYTESVLP
jgi:hypothetical protein